MTTRARLAPVVMTALAGALAVVAWLLFVREGADDPAQRVATPRQRSAPVVTPDPAQAPPPAVAKSSAASSTPSLRLASGASREEELPAVPDDLLLIVVRRAEDHAPLAGATVSWAGESKLALERDWRGGDESYVDEDELVEEVGDHGVTDARGFLFVPCDRNARFRERLVVCARCDALWALVNFDERRSPTSRIVTVDLVANDAIRVQIVDADGKPQPGLVAAFGMRGQDVGRQSRRARAEGPDAIATIRGVAAFARLFSDADRSEWGVSALVPQFDPVFLPVDRNSLPKEPLVVKLPPCGRLLFTFVASDGTPMLRKARVALNAMTRVAPGDTSGRRKVLLLQRLVAANGALEVPFVGCGLEFEVRVEVDHAGVFNEFVNGPDSAGETVERTLKLDFGPVPFTGTILRGDDAPVANERVTVRVLASRTVAQPFETPCIGEGATDEKKVFSIAVTIANSADSYDCELFVHSATGAEHTLNAVAVVGEKNGAARLGTLRLPGE